MGRGKVQVWIVQEHAMPQKKRLIRGTLKDVEQLLRSEVSIEPCSAEQAHQMADVEIEEAQA